MFLNRDSRKYTALSFLTFSSALRKFKFNGLYNNKWSLTFLQDLQLILRHCAIVVFSKIEMQVYLFQKLFSDCSDDLKSQWKWRISVSLFTCCCATDALAPQTESCAWCAPRALRTSLEAGRKKGWAGKRAIAPQKRAMGGAPRRFLKKTWQSRLLKLLVNGWRNGWTWWRFRRSWSGFWVCFLCRFMWDCAESSRTIYVRLSGELGEVRI